MSAHVCTSCGRACGPCAEAAERGHPLPHTIRAEWCTWCASIYAENAPDPETGRVHCGRCEAPFPTLAAFIERYRAGELARYPKYCGPCRPAAERQEAREAERRATPPPPDRGVESRPPAKPQKALTAAEEREANWRRGGFVPRTGPDTTESESGNGAVAWQGTGRRM